jgi:hypothetical protein
MIDPRETWRNLVELAQQDNEEGRSAAHAAMKLAKKHGFVVLPPAAPSAPAPAPAPAPRRRAPAPPPAPWSPEPMATAPEPPPEPRRRSWQSRVLGAVGEEATKFFQTFDVLPRDIPVTRVQLAPAPLPGLCPCGHLYRRGELVSRLTPHRCVRCVAGSAGSR